MDSDVDEEARLLIPIELGDEAVRVNISLPASALAALDRTAKDLSLSRSGAIAHLALTRPTHGQLPKSSTARERAVARPAKRTVRT